MHCPVTLNMPHPGSKIWLRDIHRGNQFNPLARVEAGGVDIGAELLAIGLAPLEKESGTLPYLADGKTYPSRVLPNAIACMLESNPASTKTTRVARKDGME